MTKYPSNDFLNTATEEVPHNWCLIGTEKIADDRWRVYGRCCRCNQQYAVECRGWEETATKRAQLAENKVPEGGSCTGCEENPNEC